MKIRIFGTGCAPCKAMLHNVTRIQEMIDAGITATPTLVVDGEIKSVGRALDVPALKTLLVACRSESPE